VLVGRLLHGGCATESANRRREGAAVRAIVVEQFGGPEVLQLARVAEPIPGPGEVLLRVAAAGVNPVDWKVRAGTAGERFGWPPYVPGWDLAGVVEATGDRVSAFAADDQVFGLPCFPAPAGCYAEYVCAPAGQLAAAPPGMDQAAAAGLPLAGLTALQVMDLAGVGEGQRVLVHADAGGVGHLAVQLAKARGAQVIGTARADKHPLLRELGVDQAVDYTRSPSNRPSGRSTWWSTRSAATTAAGPCGCCAPAACSP
jgi:NADPH:quinone reductase-like Zn-dependent oxidoreductase